MVTSVKFAKVREGAVIPNKRDEDAGFDIYPCFKEEAMIIYPHKTAIVPTGICSAFDSDYVFVLKERGSSGVKGIGQRSGIIDSGYRGEWGVPITNHSEKVLVIAKEGTDIVINGTPYEELPSSEVFIYPYEKAICQALLLPVPLVDVEEYTYEEIQAIPSQRGKGMLGSSGK